MVKDITEVATCTVAKTKVCKKKKKKKNAENNNATNDMPLIISKTLLHVYSS
jgi:hypothetical protein